MKNKISLSQFIIISTFLLMLFGVTYFIFDRYIFKGSDNSISIDANTTIPKIKSSKITTTPSFTPSEEPLSYENIAQNFDVSTNSYKDLMRWWVIEIAKIARDKNEDFIIIPQNCTGLFPENETDELSNYFLHTIDGVGNESLVFGLQGFNQKTTDQQVNIKATKLLIATEKGKTVLSIDYCKGEKNITHSHAINSSFDFINFQANSLELNSIPENPITQENFNHVNKLSDAKNFFVLLNPGDFTSKEDYISSLASTNYDVIIIDAFFNGENILTYEDISRLKTKANGSKRLVISYLSIGEAEDYRYYWDDSYYDNPPSWMLKENPNWAGNYPVMYWDQEWQNIIARDENSYLAKIINAGFDGVYLDIVDGYENFE